MVLDEVSSCLQHDRTIIHVAACDWIRSLRHQDGSRSSEKRTGGPPSIRGCTVTIIVSVVVIPEAEVNCHSLTPVRLAATSSINAQLSSRRFHEQNFGPKLGLKKSASSKALAGCRVTWQDLNL
jgi:hypothetical protein